MKLKKLLYRNKLKRRLASAPSFALYKTCSQLLLSRFIRILVDSDYTQLTRSGKPEQKDLLKAWTGIYLEYVSILDLPNMRYTVQLGAEIRVLETKLLLTEKILSTLYIIHDDRLTAMLRNLGFDFPFDPMQRATYYKSLEAVDQQQGTWRIELEQKEIELKQLQETDEQGEKITDDYFDDLLMILAKSQGYHLRPEGVSVSQFAVLLKRHRGKADQQRYENILKTQSF